MKKHTFTLLLVAVVFSLVTTGGANRIHKSDEPDGFSSEKETGKEENLRDVIRVLQMRDCSSFHWIAFHGHHCRSLQVLLSLCAEGG